MNRITNPAAAKVAAKLESALDALRAAAETEPAAAFYCLALAVHDAIDRLTLPPIAGGAPDEADAWPATLTPDLDGFRWEPTFEGPLPLSVLAQTAPEFEPTAEDLAEMASWSAGLFTEADALIAHGC